MKSIKIMSILFGSLMALVSMTACNKDNGDGRIPASSLKIKYTASVSQQLLDVANVTVRFIGENGQMVSEQLSATTWSKDVTIALPVRAGLSILPTLKGDVAEGEYTLNAKGQMAYTWLDQDGQQLNAGATEKTPDMGAVFYADGLGQYLNAITATCYVARSFAKDYGVTDTSISWGGNAGDDTTQGTGIETTGATVDGR